MLTESDLLANSTQAKWSSRHNNPRRPRWAPSYSELQMQYIFQHHTIIPPSSQQTLSDVCQRKMWPTGLNNHNHDTILSLDVSQIKIDAISTILSLNNRKECRESSDMHSRSQSCAPTGHSIYISGETILSVHVIPLNIPRIIGTDSIYI